MQPLCDTAWVTMGHSMPGAGDAWVESKKEVEIVEETFPSHPPATGVNPEGGGDKDGKPVAR